MIARSAAAQPLGVNALSYGVDRTGVRDSSAALQAALNAATGICFLPPPFAGKKYILHDVTIPSGVTLFAEGAYINDAAGAGFVFKLTGYNAKLIGGQISSGANCSVANIVVDKANKCEIRGTRIVNGTLCIKLIDSSNGATGGTIKTQIVDVQCDAFSVGGVYCGANVNTTQMTNVFVDANTIPVTGGQIPKAGTYGFRWVGTGSVVAFGGHSLNNCTVLGAQDGFWATDSNLLNLTACIGDTLSGAAFRLDGTTNQNYFSACYAGACAVAISVSGTAVSNFFSGFKSVYVGVVPSSGAPNWYTTAGYAAPFYEIVQKNTATVGIDLDAWVAAGVNAHSFSEAVPYAINLTGGRVFNFNSNTNVAAGSTVYLGANIGQTASEIGTLTTVSSTWSVVNAARVRILSGAAPGAGQTYTYTLRVNAAASTITGTTSGTGVFQATVTGGPIGVAPNAEIDLQLVTSAASQGTVHRGQIIFLPQPS